MNVTSLTASSVGAKGHLMDAVAIIIFTVILGAWALVGACPHNRRFAFRNPLNASSATWSSAKVTVAQWLMSSCWRFGCSRHSLQTSRPDAIARSNVVRCSTARPTSSESPARRASAPAPPCPRRRAAATICSSSRIESASTTTVSSHVDQPYRSQTSRTLSPSAGNAASGSRFSSGRPTEPTAVAGGRVKTRAAVSPKKSRRFRSRQDRFFRYWQGSTHPLNHLCPEFSHSLAAQPNLKIVGRFKAGCGHSKLTPERSGVFHTCHTPSNTSSGRLAIQTGRSTEAGQTRFRDWPRIKKALASEQTSVPIHQWSNARSGLCLREHQADLSCDVQESVDVCSRVAVQR